MTAEIGAQCRKMALYDLINTNSMEIELRTGNGKENVDEVEEEEGGEQGGGDKGEGSILMIDD